MKQNLARDHFQNRNDHGCLFVSRGKKNTVRGLQPECYSDATFESNGRDGMGSFAT